MVCVCVRVRLGAQSTLAQPKHSAEGFFFSLPDTAEINPSRKNRRSRLSRRRQSSPLFIVCENRSRGSALGWFEETRGEGGVLGGWGLGEGVWGGIGPHLNRLIRKRKEGEKWWEACRSGFSSNLVSSVQWIRPQGGSDRTGRGWGWWWGVEGWGWIGSGEIVAERFF